MVLNARKKYQVVISRERDFVRKYPEQVESEIYRVIQGNEIFLLRQSANFIIGKPVNSATVLMTNPGSFEFRNTIGWKSFKNGHGESDYFSGKDYPDMTMQNVIEVIKEGYSNICSPCCRVEIINISNIVNSKGNLAEGDHNKVKPILGEKNELLQSPIITNQEIFNKKCSQSDFIIMGFVKNVFAKEVMKLLKWVVPFQNKLVVAPDNDGWCSHPRRWRTETYLKNEANCRLQRIIKAMLS